MPNERRIVLGLGTGRCGTRSLAAWLNSQEGALISHETLGPAIPWKGGEAAALKAIQGFPADNHLGLVGDVACYYLPYVDCILAAYRTARFICLKRDREETIESFEKKTPRKNHWVNHDGVQWKHSPWDHCFPKYQASSKAEAIGLYWDEYYRRAAELEARHPSLFRVCPTEALNTEAGQLEILDFLGVPEAARRFAVGIRLNVAKPQGVRRLIYRLRRLLARGLPAPRKRFVSAKSLRRGRSAAA